MQTLSAAKWMLLTLVLLTGCTRNRYRTAADAETYIVLEQKIAGRPWQPPGFTIQVDPRSRMFDPTNPNAPTLPYPGPRLYAYQLPPLMAPGGEQRPAAEEVPVPEESLPPPAEGMARLPSVETTPDQAPESKLRRQTVQRRKRANPGAVKHQLAGVPGQPRRFFSAKTAAAQPPAPAGGAHGPVVSG